MKVLMLSLDRAILTPHSLQQEKLLRYGNAIEELHVILFYFRSRLPDCIRLTPALFVYPTNHLFRFNPFYFWHALRIGIKVIRRHAFNARCDVITAQDSFPTGIVAYALKRLSGLSIQIQVHIDFFNSYFRKESLWHEAYFRCARFLLPRADGIRVVSPFIRDYLIEELHIKAEKITLLPVCANLQKIFHTPATFSMRARYPRYSFFALILSRLVCQKNIGCAIRAIRIVCVDHPKVALVIVGSGPEESYLKKLVRTTGITERVFFVPWTNDTISYYRGADVFLFPSRYEGWGLTVSEAMVSGLPVVATAVGCVPQLIDSGKNGFIMRDDCAEDVVRAMRELISDPKRRTHMGDAARTAVFTRLPTLTNYVSGYVKALQNAISA